VGHDKLARMSKLKWLTNAIGEQFVGFWALTYGGVLVALITSILLFIFATDGGVSWWVSITFAVLAFWAVASGAFKINAALLKRKAQEPSALPPTSPSQTLTQSGINNSPIFAPVFNVGQREEQPIKEASPLARPEKEVAQEASPNLRCTVARMTRISMITGMAQEDSEGKDAAIVEFYNDPEATFPVVPVTVRASITYEELEGTHRHPVPDGIWIGWVKNHMPFRLSDSRRLVIAIREGGIIATFEHTIRKHPNLTWVDMLLARYTPLTGRAYRVIVQLIGDNPQKLRGKYEFKLTTKPEFNIQQIDSTEKLSTIAKPSENHAKRAYIIERLKELIRQEEGLNTGEWIEIVGKQSAYKGRVQRFLTEYLGESDVKRFEEKGVAALEEILKEFLS
jgi:hypothetical protein